VSLPSLSPTISARGSPLRISTNNGRSGRTGASTGGRLKMLPPFSPSGLDYNSGPRSAPEAMNSSARSRSASNNYNDTSLSGRSIGAESVLSAMSAMTLQSKARGMPNYSSSQPSAAAGGADLDELIFADRVEESSIKTSIAAKKTASKRSTIFLKQGEIKVVGPTSMLSKDAHDYHGDLNSSMDSYHSMDSMDSAGSLGSIATAYEPTTKFNKTYSQVRLGSGIEDDVSDRFLSTNKKYYPPIIYEPSKVPRRDMISEADTDNKRRQHKRDERRARMQANLDVTQTRIEYEELDKKIRDMRREEGKIGKRIRYQTAIVLDDLRAYKQQPLERMARKPNIKSADKMWGGHQERHTAKVIPEIRDFLTTYNVSFEGSQGKEV
jgi:hypothetical protein